MQKRLTRPVAVRPNACVLAGNEYGLLNAPPSANALYWVRPRAPRLVVTWMTPFAACVP